MCICVFVFTRIGISLQVSFCPCAESISESRFMWVGWLSGLPPRPQLQGSRFWSQQFYLGRTLLSSWSSVKADSALGMGTESRRLSPEGEGCAGVRRALLPVVERLGFSRSYVAVFRVSGCVAGTLECPCDLVRPSLPDTPRSLCLAEVCVQTCIARPSSRASAGAHPKPPLFPRAERTSRSPVLFGLEPSGACIDPLIVRGLRLTSLLPGKPSPWRPGPLPQRRIVNSCRQRPGSLGRGPPRPGAQGERPPRRGLI